MKDHGKHSKFELKDDGVYMVTSHYISVDGKPVLLEVIHNMKDSTIFDAFSKEDIQAMVEKSNRNT